MSSLSLVIITKNAGLHLSKAIESCADLVNEVVILDSGSTDDTIEIANKYNAKVFRQQFLGFGPQKQLAVNLAANDWVLCLDADEILTKQLKENILNELVNPKCNAYVLIRSNKFLNKYLRHGAGYPDRTIRLFNRRFANWSDDLVHERVVVNGKIGNIIGDYLHDSADSLEKYLSKQNGYTTTQANLMFAKGKRFTLSKLIISPIWHFIKYYLIKLGFLDGIPGLIHILIGSWNSFSKYAKLYGKINDNMRTRRL